MVIRNVNFKFVGSFNCAFRKTEKCVIMFIFQLFFLVAVRLGRKKKESRPATSTPLKLVVHSDASEVFYCSVYIECTQSGFSQVSLTDLAAPVNSERRWNRLCHKYVQLYLHALCS